MTTNMMAKVKPPGVFVLRDTDLDKVVLIPPDPEGEEDQERDVGHPDQSISRQRFYKVFAVAAVASITAVATLSFLALLITIARSDGSREKVKWSHNSQERTNLSGTFILRGVDDNFGPYLSSLNVPEFLHELIANAGETIEVVEPKDSGGLWRIRKVADYGDQTTAFRLNQDFTVDKRDSFSDLGIVQHRCTRPQPELLVCTTFDPGRDWHLQSVLRFTASGLEDTRTNLDAGVSSTKVYERLGTSANGREVKHDRRIEDKEAEDMIMESWD